MASTRDNNSSGDYSMQIKRHSRTFELISTSAIKQKVCFPGDGLAGHAVRVDSGDFANNAVDIESYLFGIKINDLTQNGGDCRAPPVLQINNISSVHLYNNNSSSKSPIMPNNIVVQSRQRPSLFYETD